jgi:hypothetical protein
MKYLFVFLLLVHGLIHLLGFVKAFGFADVNQLSRQISKPMGILWLFVTILLIATALFYLLQNEYWWLIALVGIFLSQLLIMFYWQDAKFGTLANIIILFIVIPAWAAWRFEHQYKKDVAANISYINNLNEPLLTTEAISTLPEPVQRYIIYSGALNKPIPKNFFIKFKGQIRADEKSEWMPFTTEQYNFIEKPTRLFYMKAIMKKLPVGGYHAYRNGIATMDIRLLSLFTVQYQSGREMDIAETVTWFNDLCLYAPGALVDERISWQPLDSLSSKAIFTFQDISISATLHFNTQGELINFTSDDRRRIVSQDEIQKIQFSTPVKDYIEINGNRVPSYGEAVWSLPKGDLVYGQFHCMDVQYNVKSQ